MLSLEGKQLGNYEVIRRIRVGGMGAVYEGKQRTAFDRRVAIKVILGDYAADADMRRRFAREARTVARLHHPHILPLIEFGEEQGMLFLVMPFIDGGTLTAYLRRSLPPLAEVAAMFQQLLDAVEHAHDAGLIHRDIKSSNVLLEMRRNGAPYVYLADFGLVRKSRKAELEQTDKQIPLDQVPGTPHYMAPEQTRGIITTSTDIYALGVLLYQMLTGELPYNDDDDVRVIQVQLHAPIPAPSAMDGSIPIELDGVVRTAMAKRSEDRFRNIAEFRQAFLAAVKGPIEVVEDVPMEIEYTAPPSSRRSVHLHRDVPLPAPMPLPVPLAPPRRMRNGPPPAPVRERQDRPRITEEVVQKPQPIRITEEPAPVRRKRKRVAGPLLATMLIPVMLLLLLLMPRVLGISLFPSGFPILGTPPVATIFVTPQTKTLQSTYVLTASPKTTTPDPAAHTIPAYVLQSSMTANSTVPTSGTKAIAGVQAHGTVEFSNSTNTRVIIPAGIIISSSGVKVQLTQNVPVPPRQNKQDGNAPGNAVALNEGASGNIAAHTLDGTCCATGIAVKNIQAFVGGTDAQALHIVAQSDIDNVQNTLLPKLKQQLVQKLQQQLPGDETTAGVPTYTTTVTPSNAVGTQVDTVNVQVSASAHILSYSRLVMDSVAAKLLDKQESQTLDTHYQAQGTPSIAALHVDVHVKDDLIYLNVAIHGTWLYVFTSQQTNQWRQMIKGATSTVALAYLNTQEGVSSVQIHLPFQADRFPTTNDGITIKIVGQDGTMQ